MRSVSEICFGLIRPAWLECLLYFLFLLVNPSKSNKLNKLNIRDPDLFVVSTKQNVADFSGFNPGIDRTWLVVMELQHIGMWSELELGRSM